MTALGMYNICMCNTMLTTIVSWCVATADSRGREGVLRGFLDPLMAAECHWGASSHNIPDTHNVFLYQSNGNRSMKFILLVKSILGLKEILTCNDM